MKKILLLMMVCNLAKSSFEVKIGPMLGAGHCYVQSDITAYEVLAMHDLHRAPGKAEAGETPSVLHDKSVHDKDAQAPMKSITTPVYGLLANIQILKIDNMKVGILVGAGGRNMYATKKPSSIEMRFKSTHWNNLLVGYIGYKISNKIDAIFGLGCSFMKGEHTIIADKKHPMHDDVHPDVAEKYNKQMNLIEDETILKTNTSIAFNVLLGGEYHLSEKLSMHAMIRLMPPLDLHIDNSKNGVFKNKTLMISSNQLLFGVSYKIL